MITMITIYSLFVVPFILVFGDVYEDCPEKSQQATDDRGNSTCDDKDKVKQPTLYKIELIIDIIYLMEIILNMLKKTRAHKEIESIATNYITGYFFFDVAGTIPELVMGESFRYYWLKSLEWLMLLDLLNHYNLCSVVHSKSILRKDKMI